MSLILALVFIELNSPIRGELRKGRMAGRLTDPCRDFGEHLLTADFGINIPYHQMLLPRTGVAGSDERRVLPGMRACSATRVSDRRRGRESPAGAATLPARSAN